MGGAEPVGEGADLVRVAQREADLVEKAASLARIVGRIGRTQLRGEERALGHHGVVALGAEAEEEALHDGRPGVGREIERLQAQTNRARVTYWRSDRGREQSSTYAWSFRVT